MTEKIEAREYRGPVLYIVHAPITRRRQLAMRLGEQEKKLFAANEIKILKALNAAGIRGIPVFYEHGQQVDVEKILQKVKHRPKIVNVKGNEGVIAGDMKKVAERERIIPTKIVCLGAYREWCVHTGAKTIRQAFPSAEITMIEGASTIFRRDDSLMRRSRRGELAEAGIKRAKKLGRKHLA